MSITSITLDTLCLPMADVTIRELRNHGGDVVDRAASGEDITITRSGRKPAARGFDSMIAAIAIANGIPVHTCNPGDFEGIDGLTVVAVPVPGH